MSHGKKIIIAFDLYGTLLSTESIAQELAKHFGHDMAKTLATAWRRYQLEYTWRLNSMNQYQSFAHVTRNSLKQVLIEHRLELGNSDVESVMRAYNSLSTFPDVDEALRAVSENQNVTAVVFSNGDDSMVRSSVKESPDLKQHASVFSALVTVENIKKFKPSPDVYSHLAKVVGKAQNQMGEMWLVSGNPFDVVGARASGMQAAWVDRAGNGWSDQLIQDLNWSPTLTGKDLSEIVESIIGQSGS